MRFLLLKEYFSRMFFRMRAHHGVVVEGMLLYSVVVFFGVLFAYLGLFVWRFFRRVGRVTSIISRAIYSFFSALFHVLFVVGLRGVRGIVNFLVISTRSFSRFIVGTCLSCARGISHFARSFFSLFLRLSHAVGAYVVAFIVGIGRFLFRCARGVRSFFVKAGTKTSQGVGYVGYQASTRATRGARYGSEFVHSFQPHRPPVGWVNRVIAFVVLALLFSLPFPAVQSFHAVSQVRADTLQLAVEGMDSIEEARSALFAQDLEGAHHAFTRAYDSFYAAEHPGGLPGVFMRWADVIPGSNAISDGTSLLSAGQELSRAGMLLSDAFAPMSKDGGIEGMSLLDLSTHTRDALGGALPHLEEASAHLGRVNTSSLPEAFRGQFLQAQTQLPALTAAVRDAYDVLDLLSVGLGEQATQRYLVVLQNTTEIRPTGGFIGSYALVDIDKGQMASIEIPGGGSYDLQGQLTEKLIPPAPLRLVNHTWQFQDANWFPDFPTSAEKLTWFYEKSGGPTVDGVIAINSDISEALLTLTGPIEMPEYDKIITAENFLLETQKAVELEYDKVENRPKAFLSDLLPLVFERLEQLPEERYQELVSILVESLAGKQIQIYLANEDNQAVLARLGIAQDIKDAPQDYLMLVDTNIAGGKTDGVIHSRMAHQVVVRDDGRLETTVRIWREHQGQKGELFTGVNNVDYLRLYVPEGSELIDAWGFSPPAAELFKNPSAAHTRDVDLERIEGDVVQDSDTGVYISNEFGKTVFGNWVQTEPGYTSVVQFTYLLPFELDSLRGARGAYSLYLQRQSASSLDEYDFHLVGLSADTQLTWSYPNDFTREGDVWMWKTPSLSHDVVLGFTY